MVDESEWLIPVGWMLTNLTTHIISTKEYIKPFRWFLQLHTKIRLIHLLQMQNKKIFSSFCYSNWALRCLVDTKINKCSTFHKWLMSTLSFPFQKLYRKFFGFNFLVEITREIVAPKRPVYTFRVDR